MSKVGDWLIDHEETVGAAIDSGLTNIEDVVAYCNNVMEIVDDTCVRNLFNEWYFGSGSVNDVMDDAWKRSNS